jgi:hypothetical protein
MFQKPTLMVLEESETAAFLPLQAVAVNSSKENVRKAFREMDIKDTNLTMLQDAQKL